MAYYSIDLISGLKPKANNDFPLIESHFVGVEETDRRLDSYLPFYCNSLPTPSADYFMRTAILQVDTGCVPYICLKNGASYEWKKFGETTSSTTPSAYLLSGLSDVAISSPTDNQALIYDNSTSKWNNKTYFRTLTQVQYDALPASKNSDNIIYFITD